MNVSEDYLNGIKHNASRWKELRTKWRHKCKLVSIRLKYKNARMADVDKRIEEAKREKEYEVKIEAREEIRAKERRSAVLHFFNVKQLLSVVFFLVLFLFLFLLFSVACNVYF